MPDQSLEYINSTDYSVLETKLKDIYAVMGDLTSKVVASRRLRYTEIDIESERKAGRLAPDELFIPQHIIDSNIRTEQSSYVQYLTQSQRAAVLQNIDDPSADNTILERDVTIRLRFDGWQIPHYANVDGMQQNGYGIIELTQDLDKPGELGNKCVQYGDLGYVMDTRDIQEAEMLCHWHYFSRTRLLAMCSDESYQFDLEQTMLVIDGKPQTDSSDELSDGRDKSLYRVAKVMFRLDGVVNVAWAAYGIADNWLRAPRSLFLGRRQAVKQPTPEQLLQQQLDQQPITEMVYETAYPYFLFPYLISENNTLSQLKGRVYLDQDCQEAVSSLMSSACTAYRRSSGLYFSKDNSDPNDDVLMQKNVYFKTGALINSKVSQFQLSAPTPDIFNAIQSLVTSNKSETSQVNFAANNRKDSRKTATEIQASQQTQQSLSTVQVVLFSTALRSLYQTMFDIIRSRVLAGLIKPPAAAARLYTGNYLIKPSGDTDVIERQQMVAQMMQAWPVMQNTPAASAFLSDMLTRMFPDSAAKYIQIFNQAQQQAASQQAQMQQQVMGQVVQMGKGIVELSKHPDYFSDVGKIHAFPVIEQAAQTLEEMAKGSQQPQQPMATAA